MSPVSYDFTPTTIIASAEVNQNFTDCESGAAMDNISNSIKFNNTIGIKFENAAGVADAFIYEDAGNILRFIAGDAQTFYFRNTTDAANLFSYDPTNGLAVSKITLSGIPSGTLTTGAGPGLGSWLQSSLSIYTANDIQCGGYIAGGAAAFASVDATSYSHIDSTSRVVASTYVQAGTYVYGASYVQSGNYMQMALYVGSQPAQADGRFHPWRNSANTSWRWYWGSAGGWRYSNSDV